MRTLPFTIGLSLVVVAGSGFLILRPDHSLERISLQGRATTDSLFAYANAQGRCPENLRELGLEAPLSDHGPFTYRSFRKGAICILSAGSYAKDGEEVWWQWPPGHWYIDQ